MPTSPDRAERHARQLARYAEIAMRAAEKVDAQLDAAEDPAALASLVSSLHKAGRSLRQSIALEARLVRDAERCDRDAQARDEARRERAVETRKAQVRHAVERLIWTELEKPEAEVWSADLEERLDAEALLDDFLDEPLEDHIERAGRELGVTGDGEREYMPRALRHQPHRFHRKIPPGAFAHFFDDDEAQEAVGHDSQAPEAPPQPDPDPAPHRLAPPMDLPSWETG